MKAYAVSIHHSEAMKTCQHLGCEMAMYDRTEYGDVSVFLCDDDTFTMLLMKHPEGMEVDSLFVEHYKHTERDFWIDLVSEWGAKLSGNVD